MNESEFEKRLLSFPVGSFYCIYNGNKYLAIKELFSNNKIIKIYAKEL